MISKKFSELRTYSRRLSAKARMLLAVVCSYVGAQRVYCVPPCDQKRFGDQNSVVGSTSWFLILVGSLQESGEWTEIQGSKVCVRRASATAERYQSFTNLRCQFASNARMERGFDESLLTVRIRRSGEQFAARQKRIH